MKLRVKARKATARVKARGAVRKAKRSVRRVARSARSKVKAVKRVASRQVEKPANRFVGATSRRVEPVTVSVEEAILEPRPIAAAVPAPQALPAA